LSKGVSILGMDKLGAGVEDVGVWMGREVCHANLSHDEIDGAFGIHCQKDCIHNHWKENEACRNAQDGIQAI